MTNDDILFVACLEAKNRLDNAYLKKLDEMVEPTVSKKTKKNIIRYISSLENNNSIGESITLNTNKRLNKKTLRTILVAAILILLFAIGSFAISPIRNYIVHTFDDHSKILFITSAGRDNLYSNYMYIPNGYEIESDEKLNDGQFTILKSEEKRIVIDSGKEKDSILVIDTENSKTEEVKFKNYTGYTSKTKTSYILVWSSGRYYHSIVADYSEDITLEDIIKIAENMVPEE